MSTGDWLNAALFSLWPNLSAAIADIIKTTVEPAVQQLLPGPLSDLKFIKIDLGSIPASLQNISVQFPSADAAELSMDVNYKGNADIQLTLSGAESGIRGVSLIGRIYILLKPFVPLIPTVGAVQIYFISPPQINFEHTGVSQIANLPKVREVIRKVVDDQVAAMMVLPNRMSFPLVNSDQVQHLYRSMYTKPERVIQLTVVEAKDLKDMDNNLGGLFRRHDVSDPYCAVRVGSQRFTTNVVKDDLNPRWGETFDFIVHDGRQRVVLDVFDKDLMSDDLMSSGDIEISHLSKGQWIALREGGSIHVSAETFDLSSANLPTAEKFLLSALIVDGHSIPTAGHQTAFVRLKPGNSQSFSTGAIALFIDKPIKQGVAVSGHASLPHEHIPNPKFEWGQGSEFLLQQQDLACDLICELVDEKSVVFGTGHYSLEQLRSKPGGQTDENIPLISSSGEKCSLNVTLQLFSLAPSASFSASPTENTTKNWLNAMVSHLWPFIAKASEEIVCGTIEPIIKSCLPSPLSFKFTKVDFGTSPMQFEKITVQDQSASRDHLQLELELSHLGNTDIEMAVSMATIGIEKITIKGRLFVLMKPLINTIPLAGAVHVYFANPPQVEYDFTNLAQIADWPIINKTIRSVINSQIAAFTVLPNRISVKLANDQALMNMFWEGYVRPAGICRVQICDAKDLKNMDMGVLWKTNRSDPYVIVSMGTDSHTTVTIADNLNPVWEKEYHDAVVSSTDQLILLDVYDEDPGMDGFLGHTEVSVKDLVSSGEISLPLSLGGTVHVKGQWLQFHENAEIIPSASEDQIIGLLTLLVDQAFSLPIANHSNALVRVTFGKASKNTTALPLALTVLSADGSPAQTKVPNPNPEWEQILEFPLIGSIPETILCEVVADNSIVIANMVVELKSLLQSGSVTPQGRCFQGSFALHGDGCTAETTLLVRFLLNGVKTA